jgi:hypothetical protein
LEARNLTSEPYQRQTTAEAVELFDKFQFDWNVDVAVVARLS